jgi:anti-sigma-K factor RskA
MNPGKPMSGTRDCGSDAAAYVLGALEPAEAHEFRIHLEQCAACRDEVASLEQAVQALPLAAPSQPVPKQLRRRVLRAVQDEPNSQPAGRQVRAPWVSARNRARQALLVAGAAAAIALAVVGAIELSTGSSTRVIQARVSGISGSAQLRLTGGRGELVVRRLSPPPQGKIYEVWLERAHGAPRPTDVLFSVTSTGSGQVGVPGNLRRFHAVLVTPEPAGGSQVPTHSPVIVVRLS